MGVQILVINGRGLGADLAMEISALWGCQQPSSLAENQPKPTKRATGTQDGTNMAASVRALSVTL